MLLAVDVGNTNVTLGLFKGETLRANWSVATDLHKTPDEYDVLLRNLLLREGLSVSDIDSVSIACVVPPLLTIMEELSQRILKITPLVVEPGTKTGVRICMDNPREVGADRIVNAAAAHHLYKGPLIVMDFGTATTFDVVSKEGDYLGGIIAPGILISAEALFERASKLPRVELIAPEHVIGKNTVLAMQSGILFGYVGLVESLVSRIRQEMGGKAHVVATGGLARIIAKETKVIDTVNMHLTLIGLRLIHELNQQEGKDVSK